MATIKVAVPDDVKDKFDALFDEEAKSAVVTELLRRAIDDEERRRQSRSGKSFSERIDEIRAMGRPVTQEEIRAALDELRQ